MTARDRLTIYHNPSCTKSRATLALLRDRGFEPQIIEYLLAPLTPGELEAIVHKLGIKPGELLRKAEELYKAKYAGKTLTDKECIEAMVRDPILMERPIVVRGGHAAIGRPPDSVLPLIAD